MFVPMLDLDFGAQGRSFKRVSSTGLIWSANKHTGGISTGQPS